MRKVIGGVVIVAGVVGTGWYGTVNNAKTMQVEVKNAAANAQQGTIHPISTRVSGRDIFVSGTANSEAERDQILAKLNGINGRRVVRDDLRVLDTASPFVFNAKSDPDGTEYSGMIPTEVDRTTVATRIGDAANDLDLMAGAPDTNWTGVIDQGLNSLDVLENGTLSVSGNVITVSGDALTPREDAAARAALADLPNDYTANFDIAVLDDGTPFRLTMDRAEDGTVVSAGKIPSTLEAADLSAALGSDVGTNIEQSVLQSDVVDWPDAAKIGASALGKLRSGQMQIAEDTLKVTGVATPDGKAAAEALLATMPNGVTATSDISLYDDGVPFTLEMLSNSDGTTAMGKFPADVAVGDIIGDVAADGIRTAFISDDTAGFGPVATSGVAALGQLDEGKLSVVGTDVMLSGIAQTPNQANAAKELLGDLPDGYNANFDIETIDDGTPPNFDVVYTAAGGATVSGKLPAGTQSADIASALNLSAVSGDPIEGLIGDGAVATEKLSAVANWLPELDSLSFNSNDAAVTVDAVAAPGVDLDLAQAGLADALGDGVSLTLTAATDLPSDGATRMNQATGRAEAFTAGYWLPVIDFASDVHTCNAQSADALQADRITFLSGSAQLDAQSTRSINAVAAIVRKCLIDTDLSVEIGGHTDSQGGEDLNQDLSQKRAEAVRSALIARGAAGETIFAQGYGEAEPIADNETAEGRAANRRTAITWFTPVAEEPVGETEEAGTSDDAADTQLNTEAGE